MKFQVPQYVDLEDKLAFRLTLRQLGWFALGGFLLFMAWVSFSKVVFWFAFPLIAALATAFAFYRPGGLPLFTFLWYGFLYFIKPKRLFWDKKEYGSELSDTLVKNYQEHAEKPRKNRLEEILRKKKEMISRSAELARILDEKSDL